MSNSVQRELEEIERRRKLQAAQQHSGARRGSSIFAIADDNDDSGPYGRPGYLDNKPGDLLVDFPEAQRHLEQNQYSGLAQQSAYSDSYAQAGQMMGHGGDSYGYGGKPRLGEAARMQELANSKDLPGGINHRPLVGGFAAAAYEAARAHHYSAKKSDNTGNIPRDRPPPPCI